MQRFTRQIRRVSGDARDAAEAVRELHGAIEGLLEAGALFQRMGQQPPRCSPNPRTARLQTAATCFLAVILVSRAQEATNQGGQERPRSREAELAAARNAARQMIALIRRNEALLARVRQLEAREARLPAAEERIRRLEEENRSLRAGRAAVRVAYETKNREAARESVLHIRKVTARKRVGKPLQLARR